MAAAAAATDLVAVAAIDETLLCPAPLRSAAINIGYSLARPLLDPEGLSLAESIKSRIWTMKELHPRREWGKKWAIRLSKQARALSGNFCSIH